MSDTRNKLQLATFFLFTTIASVTYAEPGNPGGHFGGPHGGPPPEALDACANLAEGDACSFTGRRDETVEGICIMPPNDEEALVCAPEGGPPGGGRGPMPPPQPENAE